jgi:tetratricopeptide (TPR) repeat protein
MEAARGYLAESESIWSVVDSAADAELKNIVFKRGEDVKRSLAREEIHRRQAQARLGQAWARYETGLTFAPHSSENKAALQEAGRRFDAIYDQQRERLAGYYARLGRGMCCRELGDVEKAFSVFEELFSRLPDAPADFHSLRGKAAVQALEISLRPEAAKYKQGLDIARRWIEAETPASAPTEVGLAIEFLGAEAARGYLNSLPPPSTEQLAIRGRQVEWMRRQYEAVAAVAGPYQARAKVRLLDRAMAGAAAAEAEKTSDVLTRAKAALERLVDAEAQQKAARQSGVNDPDAERQWRQQVVSARSEALDDCRQALEGPAAVSGQERDTARYYLAYLHYGAGEFEESAAQGEAVLQSAAESPAARQAVRIGLAAREALYRAAQEDAQSAPAGRLRTLAEATVRRWGSYPEADDARAVLTDLAVAQGQLEKAEDYLRQISARSPRRGETEMGVGKALWAHAQRLMRISTVEHDHAVEAEQIAARAADLLGDGIARCRDARSDSPPSADAGITSNSSSALPGAILSLAQIEMFLGRASEAVDLLESGSLSSAVDASSLRLLAYIAAGKLDKARGSLQAIYQADLKQDNGKSGRQIVQMSIRFGRLTARHLARYRDRRMDEVLKQTVGQLDAFLAAPAEGPAADSLFVNVFRAEALAGFAAGLDSGGPAVPLDAQQRYRQAIAAFEGLLHRLEAEKDFGRQSDAVVALRIDLARCLRRMSDNVASLSQLLVVLKEHPRMIDAQLEAAYTFQSWGDERPEYLELAIQGGGEHPEVWGFGELARRVQPEARFREVFFETRYNLALCRFRQAQMSGGRPDQSRLTDAAAEDILATRRVDQDLGGPLWYDRFDELFRRLQRLADKPATGLPSR